MAAAILKSIARWMEGQLDHGGPCHSLVQSVLTQLVQEANPGSSRYSGAQGPTIHENEAWDSILPTQQSILATEPEVGKLHLRRCNCTNCRCYPTAVHSGNNS